MNQWMCAPCGHVYDEREGAPEHGIAPGTSLDQLPPDWVCPDCGVGLHEFIQIPD